MGSKFPENETLWAFEEIKNGNVEHGFEVCCGGKEWNSWWRKKKRITTG